MQMLLEQYPGAARVAVPSSLIHHESTSSHQHHHHYHQQPHRLWRTPLCQAISSGLWWNSIHKHYPDGTDGPLKRLWKYAPEALESRDVITGLYPFMLAAVSSHVYESRLLPKCEDELIDFSEDIQ